MHMSIHPPPPHPKPTDNAGKAQAVVGMSVADPDKHKPAKNTQRLLGSKETDLAKERSMSEAPALDTACCSLLTIWPYVPSPQSSSANLSSGNSSKMPLLARHYGINGEDLAAMICEGGGG